MRGTTDVLLSLPLWLVNSPNQVCAEVSAASLSKRGDAMNFTVGDYEESFAAE